MMSYIAITLFVVGFVGFVYSMVRFFLSFKGHGKEHPVMKDKLTALIEAMKAHARQGATRAEAQDLWIAATEQVLDALEEAEVILEKEFPLFSEAQSEKQRMKNEKGIIA